MLTYLQSIIDFFVAIGKLLFSLARGIQQLLSMLPGALAMVTSSIAAMPSVLVAFGTAAISVSIVYLIVGR